MITADEGVEKRSVRLPYIPNRHKVVHVDPQFLDGGHVESMDAFNRLDRSACDGESLDGSELGKGKLAQLTI